MEHFKEGELLSAIWYDNGHQGYSVTGNQNVERITVAMVTGHMANLPFARVEFIGGVVSYIPIHGCSEVYKIQPKPDGVELCEACKEIIDGHNVKKEPCHLCKSARCLLCYTKCLGCGEIDLPF